MLPGNCVLFFQSLASRGICFWGARDTASGQFTGKLRNPGVGKGTSSARLWGQFCTGHVGPTHWRPGHRREVRKRIITIATIIQ